MSTGFQVLPRASRQLSYSSLLPYVFGLPRAGRKCQALYAPQGQGEIERVDEAFYLWETTPAMQHLLIAGGNPDEEGTLSAEQLEKRFKISQRTGVRVQDAAQHSRAQVDWAASICGEKDIRDLAVLAPPYHLLRQMLMMYSALRRQGILIPLIPVPLRVTPGNITARTTPDEPPRPPGAHHISTH